MTQRYRIISDLDCAYFVTCTVVDWLPIFEQQDFRQLVLDSLAYTRENKRTQLNAFVIMPTHLHTVLWPAKAVNLSDVLRDFKGRMFTAQFEIQRLEWLVLQIRFSLRD